MDPSDINLERMIVSLLCKVNKVTSYFRHGQKIPEKSLIDLSNYQIEFEKIFKSEEALETYKKFIDEKVCTCKPLYYNSDRTKVTLLISKDCPIHSKAKHG